MPWCDDCARYFAPSAMNDDGTCPSCGRSLERSAAEVTAKSLNLRKLAAGADGDEADSAAPWHFKLLMLLLALYLIWRVVDLFV